jgi:hypothetical protein
MQQAKCNIQQHTTCNMQEQHATSKCNIQHTATYNMQEQHATQPRSTRIVLYLIQMMCRNFYPTK